ncbi:MAG: ABC transporter permease [Burkholderiales bacterium]|nr:ABC transporter permease [Burkholderiales bacterium]MDE2393853.1 ABC transporter permease [Burkholderiales bacterium]
MIDWFVHNAPRVGALALTHAWLAALPLVLGLAIALPLGWLAHRLPRLRLAIVSLAGALYTVPSLVLFILLPLVLGTRILDPFNVVVAMTLYTVALLVRTVADGLASVPEEVRQAALAMGFGAFRRWVSVELPLALPVISAGLRVAAVSNVSIVSIAALIGVVQLGSLFTEGFALLALPPIVVGSIACVLLAFVFDLAIIGLTRLATPWARGRA